MSADALHRFIDARAIRLPSDVSRAHPALLEPLTERLAGHDVVALGETNHFVHEKSDFRLLLARWLVRQGWLDFFEEIGWSDGYRVNAYLATGDERQLDRLPSFGYTAHLRNDRDDRPGGILKMEHYPTEAFLAEQKRFYRGLRDESGGRARLAGIDIDALPGGGYEDIAALIPPGDGNADAFLRGLRRVPGETARDEAARLRAIRPPSNWPGSIVEALAALSNSHDYIARTYSARTYDAVRPGMAYREEEMKRRLLAAARLFDSKRFVVLAHALHLAKDDGAIVSSGVGPGGNRVDSLGHWLTHAQRRKVFAVWMIYGGGEDCQPLPSLPCHARFAANTLNSALRAFDVPLLFFPSDAPELFGRPMKIGHIYNAVFETPLAAQADAVVFLPKVSPLRA